MADRLDTRNSSKPVLHWAALLLLVAGGATVTASSAAPADDIERQPTADSFPAPLVSCRTNKVVAAPDDVIDLRAAAILPGKDPSQSHWTYAWTVTAGTVDSQTADTRWNLSGVSSGQEVTATVLANTPTAVAVKCSVRVYVVKDVVDLGPLPRTTGRSFLLPKQKEETRFGLYSYLLFASPPRDFERDRYLEIIRAYLAQIYDVNRLIDYFLANKLNITYLPLETAIPEGKELPGDLAAWILEHYDYFRARILLNRIPGEYRDGIHIVAFEKPLSSETPTPPYLDMTLSTIPSTLARSWVNEYIAQAAQERYSQQRSLPQLLLRLRTAVEVLALAQGEVLSSLEKDIKLVTASKP
jgi:hypothetical protein